MKLQDIKIIEGVLELKSGLHIGAGDTAMRIGGTDNPVVTHPHTGLPYIPGSSLKGKIRSLLEMQSGLLTLMPDKQKGNPLSGDVVENWKEPLSEEAKSALDILRLFGSSSATDKALEIIGPTRASFADCPISDTCRQFILANNLPFTEVKSENTINRIEGTARNPRFTERVPAGVRFKFSVTLKVMEGDGDLLKLLLQGCALLERDALGGSGSRGYGRVRFDFSDPEVSDRTVHELFEEAREKLFSEPPAN